MQEVLVRVIIHDGSKWYIKRRDELTIQDSSLLQYKVWQYFNTCCYDKCFNKTSGSMIVSVTIQDVAVLQYKVLQYEL